jgi:hypothetical protein
MDSNNYIWHATPGERTEPKGRIVGIGTIQITDDGREVPSGWLIDARYTNAPGVHYTMETGVYLYSGWTIEELKAIADAAQEQE